MKGLIGFALFLFTTTQLHAIGLLEAIQQKNISVEITKVDKKDNFMFPDKNLVLRLLNTTGQTITLEIKPGYLLESEELSASNWVIINKSSHKIASDIFIEIGLSGMSLQKLLNEPSIGSSFNCKQMAAEQIVEICEFIYQNNFNSSIGQDALWAVNKDQPIHSIDGPNEITVPIKHYVASLLGVNEYHQPGHKNLIYVDDNRNQERLLFEFEIHPSDNIKIEVVDANETHRNELLDRDYKHRMNHAIYYNLSLQNKSGQKLYVRSYQNDELLEEYIIVVEQENSAITAESKSLY